MRKEVEMLNEIFKKCDGITYTREVPKKAVELAKENGFIIIVGGSDDLMYCYGADSYLTDYCEHNYGWDGDNLENIEDKQLECEAKQLGLKIFWCGEILSTGEKIQGYDTDKQGAFSYKVKDGINFKDFIVYEDEKKDEVYCTGIIIELPKDFKSCKKRS